MINYPLTSYNINLNTEPILQKSGVKRSIVFTSNPDTFTNQSSQETKNNVSNNAKWLLGALAIAGIATITYFATKGKSGSKSIREVVDHPELKRKSGNKPIKEVIEHAEFKNITDAQNYFEQLGIKTIFKDGTERHLEDLNAIKKDLAILNNNGVEIPKPNVIVFSDWSKKAELEEILRGLNLSNETVRDIAQTLNNNTGMWGTIDSVINGGNIVFVNNRFSLNFKKFIHEMGHLHQDLETSFWHSKGLKGKSFRQKQAEILGLEISGSSPSLNLYKNWSNQSLDDIFRTSCNGGVHTGEPDLKQRICNIFPELNGNFETLFFTPVMKPDGSVDACYINAKKMVEKMHAESRVYAPHKAFENVAEIFEGLNYGKTYSDEVMLMYDFCGGGRVPNLVIKGKKYDDYIQSLYENKNLIESFRELFEIRKLS